jgi:hypothetical protein
VRQNERMYGIITNDPKGYVLVRIRAEKANGDRYWVHRSFSYSIHGGRESAIELAISTRDNVKKTRDVARYLKRQSGIRFNSTSPVLKSKRAFKRLLGIRLVKSQKNGKAYWSVSAGVGSHSTDADPERGSFTKAFALATYGVVPAVRAAIRHREDHHGGRLYTPDDINKDLADLKLSHWEVFQASGIEWERPSHALLNDRKQHPWRDLPPEKVRELLPGTVNHPGMSVLVTSKRTGANYIVTTAMMVAYSTCTGRTTRHYNGTIARGLWTVYREAMIEARKARGEPPLQESQIRSLYVTWIRGHKRKMKAAGIKVDQ